MTCASKNNCCNTENNNSVNVLSSTFFDLLMLFLKVKQRKNSKPFDMHPLYRTIGKECTYYYGFTALNCYVIAFYSVTLTGGTKIRCSNGSTLTMSEFQTALTVNSGAEVNDGTYIFKDNKSTTRGINIQGSVKGSADRDSVVIKADDKAETNFYSGNATFENATIEIVSRT